MPAPMPTPTAAPADRATLSQAISVVRRTVGAHLVAAERDALFDGGEFSGAFHSGRAMALDAQRRLTPMGWTLREVEEAAAAATSDRWLWHSGLDLSSELDEPLDAHWV